jgi:hypothetical protein
MPSPRSLRVKQIARHRNGICGLPFTVAIVAEKDQYGCREMLVVRFDKSADKDTGNIVCAAFDLAKLAQGDIEFGSNSWRGDHYNEVIDRRRS